MSDKGESFENPEIAAEYEEYLDSKPEPVAQDFQSWQEQMENRPDDRETVISENRSHKQRPF